MVVVVGAWFYVSFAEKPAMPKFFPAKKTAGFTIETDERVFLNQPFKVRVVVNTQNNTINAVGLTVNYESEKLKVLGLDTTQSFCQFYPEKKFSDNLGKINLSCGSPSPGFSGTNTVIIIDVMPIKMGTTELVIDQSSKILKSNGTGTNLLSTFPRKELVIINSL